MKKENREKAIEELMTYIRKNTESSSCIDVYEGLLKEIEIGYIVETAVSNMNRFIGDFSRLCKDIDNMKGIEFIAKMLTYEFIQPERYFTESKKYAKEHLWMSDILIDKCNIGKRIEVSKKNRIGTIYHKKQLSKGEFDMIVNMFNLDKFNDTQCEQMFEMARKVVLLYNYMPAIVKALIQTKRRSLGLDQNSTKFGKH